MKMNAAHLQVPQSVQRETVERGELESKFFSSYQRFGKSALKYFIFFNCRKTESCDMQDLVHMMTETLRMDVGDSVNVTDKGRLGSSTLQEFKLNRKYRDTLLLHGKAREEAENLSLGEIPIGTLIVFLVTFLWCPHCVLNDLVFLKVPHLVQPK